MAKIKFNFSELRYVNFDNSEQAHGALIPAIGEDKGVRKPNQTFSSAFSIAK